MSSVVLQHVTKSYHDADRELVVLQDLSCSFPEAKRIAIMGRSGVGKSTLLQILGGLDKPTSGSVTVGDTDITALSDDARSAFRGKNFGFVFQFHHLLPEFTALENVAMPRWIAGESDATARAEAATILERVGLSSRLSHRPSELSGGEQQRVAIARALISRPKVILADEPTGNLDAVTARDVEELLFSLQQMQKTTLIVVTHSQELASRMDVVLEMRPGGTLAPRDGLQTAG